MKIVYERLSPMQPILLAIVNVENSSTARSVLDQMFYKLEKRNNTYTVICDAETSGYRIIMCRAS